MSQPKEREIIRATILAVCAAHARWAELTASRQAEIARRIERNCLEVTIAEAERDGVERLFSEKKFIERYSMTCAKIISNLDVNSSVGDPYLLSSIIDGVIDEYKVANMSSVDLCPGSSQALRDELEMRINQKINRKVSRAYRCRKCGNNETVFIEYQARASDEGATISVRCIHCDYTWRK